MFSLQQLCTWGGLQVVQAPRPDVSIARMSGLVDAGADAVAFFFSKAYQGDLIRTQAGVLVTGDAFVEPLLASGLPQLKSLNILSAPDPYRAMALLSREFAAISSHVAHLPKSVEGEEEAKPKIDPSAYVAQGVNCERGVVIGANCVVESGAHLGAGTRLYPGCYVGHGVQIGPQTVLFPQVVIYENAIIGARVRIHAHTTLGADGFGYAPELRGGVPVDHTKIYHLGRVRIGDDVEIGANVTIDRGTLSDTVIEARVKIDNHVHIGHNAWVAEGAILCGGTCLAGNARIGRFAYVGGLAGVINQIDVGENAQVGAMTLVSKDVVAGTTVIGNPQREHREHFRVHALLNRLLKEKKK